jgi:hypothetical protein
MVTGLELTYHDYTEEVPAYTENDEPLNEKSVFKGTLAIGTHTITFQEPIHDAYIYSGSNISVVSSGANYIVVNKTVSSGTVEIHGWGYP